MNEADIQKDVKENKVKEGMMIKQSRHIKEWRERWMVLTKTYMYSFSQKGAYKNPTEIVPLADVQTIKSFYKGQYQKPHVFRLQTNDIHLYLSAKSNEDKIAWMTAIQKMINRIISPNQVIDNYAIIRQTLKMVGVTRETTMKSKEPNILSMLKMSINSKIVDLEYQSPLKKKASSNQLSSIQQNKSVKQDKKIQIFDTKQLQKKQPEIKQKIVEVQKVVYVPQIKQKVVQKIVQKTVYINQNQQNDKLILQNLFQLIIDNQSPNQNPKYMVDFIIYILSSNLPNYHQTLIEFCLAPKSQRFFSQIFLIMLNQQSQEQRLNNYFKFLIIMYDHAEEYLYSSDIKVLIDIILRQIQMNRSQLNQLMIMMLLKKLASKSWWKKIDHRKPELKNVIIQLGSISGPQNQLVAEQLVQCL